jgi:clan AA aspartic protease (TIGR02281 family)
LASTADLLFDTGASLTILSRSVVEAAGYDLAKAKHRQRILTGNGTIELPMLQIAALKVAEIEIRNLMVCVHDIPGETNVEGLLGVNALRTLRTVIDYPQGYFEILES